MEPITGAALISGGSSLVGGLMGNFASAKEAAKNRSWQEYMSNTAHQREAADLQKAGLNRILSVTRGAGASTPSGSTASQTDPITPAVASALSAFRTMAEATKSLAETVNVKEQKYNIQQEREKIAQDTSSAKQLQHKAYEETLTEMSRRTHINAQALNTTTLTNLLEKQNVSQSLTNQILSSDVQTARAAARRALTEEQIDGTLYGIVMRYIDRGMKSVSPFIPKARY